MDKRLASETFSGLLNEGKYSDLTLQCQGERFSVHKSFVCWRSPVLAAAIDGGFKEASTNCIIIEDYDAGTVKCMLSFMYTGSYALGDQDESKREIESPKKNAASDASPPNDSVAGPKAIRTGTRPLLQHVRVNSIGGYYQIPDLVKQANHNIKQYFRPSSDKIDEDLLCECIDEAYRNSGDEEVQKIIGEAALAQIEGLVAHKDFDSIYGLGDSAQFMIKGLIEKSKGVEEAHKLEKLTVRGELSQVRANYYEHRQRLLRERSALEERLKKAALECDTLCSRNSFLGEQIAELKDALEKAEKKSARPPKKPT